MTPCIDLALMNKLFLKVYCLSVLKMFHVTIENTMVHTSAYITVVFLSTL